jgi:outer membrane murein-binding lipoprotein Lpp
MENCPMDVQVIQTIVTLVASSASAWGGAKYALRYLEKTSDKLEKDMDSMRVEMRKVITIDHCKESKIACRADKSNSVSDIFAKIDSLRAEVIEQNRRREDAKDENTKLYFEIANKLARLEARIESLMERDRP